MTSSRWGTKLRITEITHDGCWCSGARLPRPCRSGAGQRRPARELGAAVAHSPESGRLESSGSAALRGVFDSTPPTTVQLIEEQRQATGRAQRHHAVVERFHYERATRSNPASPYGLRVPVRSTGRRKAPARTNASTRSRRPLDDGIIVRYRTLLMTAGPDYLCSRPITGAIVTAEVGGSALFASRSASAPRWFVAAGASRQAHALASRHRASQLIDVARKYPGSRSCGGVLNACRRLTSRPDRVDGRVAQDRGSRAESRRPPRPRSPAPLFGFGALCTRATAAGRTPRAALSLNGATGLMLAGSNCISARPELGGRHRTPVAELEADRAARDAEGWPICRACSAADPGGDRRAGDHHRGGGWLRPREARRAHDGSFAGATWGWPWMMSGCCATATGWRSGLVRPA